MLEMQSRILPSIPGSPEISTSPAFAWAQPRISSSISSSRPGCRGGAFYAASSVAPEIPERLGGKRSVSDGVPDVLTAQIILDRARIVPVTGELVAGAVPQHVGMNLEGQPGLLTSPLDHPVERGRREGRTAFAHENEQSRRFFPQLAQFA
jgi:hypothetical protein